MLYNLASPVISSRLPVGGHGYSHGHSHSHVYSHSSLLSKLAYKEEVLETYVAKTGFFRMLVLIISIFILSGCTGSECYDADDFGFATFDISSRYTSEEMNNQSGANQVAPWRDSNYRVNGRPLAILIKYWEYDKYKNSKGETSAWCAWFGTKDNPW